MREEDTLNILLEFVPGGSIQSLLGKLGSFPEPVSNHQSVWLAIVGKELKYRGLSSSVITHQYLDLDMLV